MPKKIGGFIYKGEPIEVYQSTYKGGRAAIYFTSCGLLFATLTINLIDQPLKVDEFLVKTWSENEELAPFVLKETSLFEDTGITVETGFTQASIWRFKREMENADNKRVG